MSNNKRKAQASGPERTSTMKTRFYLDGKKTKRKAVKELIGEDRLKKMIAEAKETFFEDSYIENSFFLGSGTLTIEFE